jgi:predicted DNA repair protein MutK
MSVGLLALLDDIAGIAKVAAASIDDVLGHAAKAGAKSAGVVIDDAAVTPRYVTGFAAERELPIIARIAKGSLRNKLLFLLPAALALAFFAPWAITPLLMLGGAYLCYEGAEKVYESIFPHDAHEHEAKVAPTAMDPRQLEDRKVASAIKTDFILSAEIMAIALAAIPVDDTLTRAVVLALVGIGITFGVYGAVALIVKADDVGVALARRGPGPVTRAIGRGLVRGMPGFLRLLALVGTAAMIWVGGGIIVHGLATFGFAWPEHLIHDAAEAAIHAVPVAPGFVGWLVGAAGAGVVGLAVGLALIPLVSAVLAPLARWLTGLVVRDPQGDRQ